MSIDFDKLISLVTFFMNSASILLKKDKSLLPVAMVLDNENEMHLYGLDFGSRDAIPLVNKFLKQCIDRHNALALITVNDTYHKICSRGEGLIIPEGKGVKDVPGHGEGILVQGFAHGLYFSLFQKYLREPESGEIIYLDEPEESTTRPDYDSMCLGIFEKKQELH